MRQSHHWRWMVLLLIACCLLGGCTGFNPLEKLFPGQPQPQQPPAPGGNKNSPSGSEPTITVYMHTTGQTQSMKMEDYITGVVAGEMRPEWPLEALASQAILARTFTVQAIETKGGVPARGTQASTDIKEFQAYDASAVNDRVRQAVAATRGLVVTYQGQPIQAWFHASAGGQTATAKEGLDYEQAEPPYIRSVASPDDAAPADVRAWQVSFSEAQVRSALTQLGKTVSRIDSITIGKRGPSGRATTLLVNGTTEVSAPAFRVALDSMKLKSMRLDSVSVSGGQVTFKGKGYGHGVGVSQWGAYQMATSGQTAAAIIQHYFTGINIEKRWE